MPTLSTRLLSLVLFCFLHFYIALSLADGDALFSLSLSQVLTVLSITSIPAVLEAFRLFQKLHRSTWTDRRWKQLALCGSGLQDTCVPSGRGRWGGQNGAVTGVGRRMDQGQERALHLHFLLFVKHSSGTLKKIIATTAFS